MTDQSRDPVAEEVVGATHDATTTEEPSVDEVVGEPVGVPADAGDVDAPTDGEPSPDAVEDEQPDWEGLAAEDPRSAGELLAELTEAEARRDEYLEDVRRARAEFENYRKRVMREGTAQRDAGRADVVARLLDVLDDFDRTLDAAGTGADESFVKGVAMVRDKLVGTLADLGLERIDGTGVPFDPNRHEAVQQVAADEPVDEPTVSQVFRPGYELGGRVLRAAMVVVSQ